MAEKDNSAWLRLCELEPQLLRIEQDLRAVKDDPEDESFCANEYWYRHGFKAWASSLVGWLVPADRPAELRTPQAYDVACQYLYDLLPNCRNCGCMFYPEGFK